MTRSLVCVALLAAVAGSCASTNERPASPAAKADSDIAPSPDGELLLEPPVGFVTSRPGPLELPIIDGKELPWIGTTAFNSDMIEINGDPKAIAALRAHGKSGARLSVDMCYDSNDSVLSVVVHGVGIEELDALARSIASQRPPERLACTRTTIYFEGHVLK